VIRLLDRQMSSATTHTDEDTKLSRNSKARLDAHGLAWAKTRKV
jgi:hypothetical protein